MYTRSKASGYWKQYQRQLLDFYANSKLHNDEVNGYEQWKRSRKSSLLETNQGKSHRMELLEYQLKELDSLSLDPLELESIEERHKNLTFSENNLQVYYEIKIFWKMSKTASCRPYKALCVEKSQV